MSEVDHSKVRAHNEIMSALWRHVQALQGLAGLFQSVDRRNDVCIDYEGIGDLIQTLTIDMRRIVQQLDEAC